MTGKDKLIHEAKSAFKKANYDGIALLPTGTGKSKLMIEIAKELNPNTILYLCNTVLLRDKMFLNELAKWDALYLIDRMDLQCYQTFCKKKDQYYDLLLADEFDAALTPEYIKALTNNKFGKRILVSATLDDAKLRIAKTIAPIIFERTPIEIADANIVNKVKFYFVNYYLSPVENSTYLGYNIQFKKLLNGFRDAAVEKKLEWLQITRKQFLSSLKSSLEVTKWLIDNLQQKGNDKILVFCGLSEQSDKVCKHSYHSNNNEDQIFDDFDKGKIRVLSVVNKVDRGLNIADIRNIIFESTGKSKTRITQRIGRGLRLPVDQTLNVFFLVPHFMDGMGNKRATIVQTWILESTRDMDLSGSTTITYKK